MDQVTLVITISTFSADYQLPSQINESWHGLGKKQSYTKSKLTHYIVVMFYYIIIRFYWSKPQHVSKKLKGYLKQIAEQNINSMWCKEIENS